MINLQNSRQSLCALLILAGILSAATAVKPPKITEDYAVRQLLVPALAGFVDPADIERRLWDRTRADFLSDKYAFEVDWSKKWAEGIGQSLFYATMTGKEPALFLLVVDLNAERRFIYRAKIAADYAGVSLGVYDVTRKKIISAPMFGLNPQAPW